MTRPVRVVVLDHTAQLGGAELALVRLCAALDPARVSVMVVLFEHGPLEQRLLDAGARVRVLELDGGIRSTDRFAAGSAPRALASAAATIPFVVRLARTLRALRPDVVHATSLKADLLALPAAALAGVPLVWHVHDRISADYLPGGLAAVVRVLARRGPRHVVVNSRATAATLLPLPRGWTLAHPGLSPDQVVAAPEERPDPPPPVVGLVGRISPTKGQREFVLACAVLATELPTARFRIVGAALFSEAAYEREVRDLVESTGLSERFTFTGWVADPTAEIDGLGVLVHASPTPEPFGQVVVEGMARAVPVVATSGGGVDEIALADDGTARCSLVEPRDVPGLAAAIAALVADPEAARRRALTSWAEVRSTYAIERTAATITAVWESLAPRARR